MGYWIEGISRKHLLYPLKRSKVSAAPRTENDFSIEQHSEEVSQRFTVGHFEIDLVILNHQQR